MSGNQDPSDRIQAGLSFLHTYEPDPARDAIVRGRCLAALEKRRSPAALPGGSAWRFRFEPAIVVTLCAVYLLEVLERAVRLYPF